MNTLQQLKKAIRTKRAKIGVVGIGYVGASVAEGAAGVGFDTIGFDVDKKKIAEMQAKKQKHLTATTDMSRLSACDVICICVPTPLAKDRSPELRFLLQAAKTVSISLRKGQLVILESSVAPGTTQTILLPILAASRFVCGKDFFLGYSPERIDPGNVRYTIHTIPKVVSGIDGLSRELTAQFYQTFIKRVVPVSSPETAEMTKILENLFRLVNISLVNELITYAQHAGVNIWEVIDAAATKPFGFLPHYPSAGAGGYCIPVLPRFLLDDARKRNVELPLVATAMMVNDKRPKDVAKKALSLVNGQAKGRKPRVLLIGITYKAENHDTRESTALRVWEEAEALGADVNYHDPYVPQHNGKTSLELTKEDIQDHDVVIIATAHQHIAYSVLLEADRPLVDTRNILKAYARDHVHRG